MLPLLLTPQPQQVALLCTHVDTCFLETNKPEVGSVLHSAFMMLMAVASDCSQRAPSGAQYLNAGSACSGLHANLPHWCMLMCSQALLHQTGLALRPMLTRLEVHGGPMQCEGAG